MDRDAAQAGAGRAVLSASDELRGRGRVGDRVLELRAVAKSFGSIRAVDGLTLDVQRGEILTLLGPSGCGKTTTLRTIIGLERCDAGEIIYDGRVLDSRGRGEFVPAHKRHMGMVFQSYAIWPHMNVFENVAYPLRVRGVRGKRVTEAVANALELTGLTGMAERAATQLSGGQQQRVALARSLVFEPNILLLDEPFSNLDAQLRIHMRAELKQLQRRLGVTVLLVTHDQVEALSVSDRIAVMRLGRLEQVGTPQQLYREPATVSVRDFIGRTIVLDGVIDEVRDRGTAVRLANQTTVVARGEVIQNRLSVGARAQVAVRPEQVQVAASDGAECGANRLAGRIDAVLFVGDHYEATASLDIGQTVMVDLPPTDDWRDGQRITLLIRPEDVRVWSV